MGCRKKTAPDRGRLVGETVNEDYIALTQKPGYANDAGWKNEAERPHYVKSNKLRFLRPYQLGAVRALQREAKAGKERFLFEMATGTGKTLTAAAVIKLFLKTGNAVRALFLVDRLELEGQAKKTLAALLSNDFTAAVFKENRDSWRRAEIVVSTVQSFLFNNKYKDVFAPTDFDFVVSDEAHRSIGGNARAVFDYFIGYKLGLTATPKDYLKKFDKNTGDPREYERRVLLDTYRAFGCAGGSPTFRYSLTDGVKDGCLVSPTVLDARTEVTTELLSEEGFTATFTDGGGEEREETYRQRQFEKRFFSKATNQLFCKTFLENALRDPVSGEIGKSVVFAASQNHAAKLAQILNQMADRMFPGKYQSDFAAQVTSDIASAQEYTVRFANNNLLGSANFIESYRTSKTRVCVTVGMMTTGYDCPDILNIGLFRPVFSPTDFIQIKGRGTRRHDFREQLLDGPLKEEIREPEKKTFKLMDFFASCEYFEEEFNYDEVLPLPHAPSGKPGGSGGTVANAGTYEHLGGDLISSVQEENVGYGGMKIDRMFFQSFEETVRGNGVIADAVEAGQWDRVIGYVNEEVMGKPEEYYTLEKLRKAADADRRITLREILEKIFGLIPKFKSKDELLEEEFAKFVADAKPGEAGAIPAIRNYFKAYAADSRLRDIIDNRKLTELATNPAFSTRDYKEVPEKYRAAVPDYIKDYVPLNQFMP